MSWPEVEALVKHFDEYSRLRDEVILLRDANARLEEELKKATRWAVTGTKPEPPRPGYGWDRNGHYRPTPIGTYNATSDTFWDGEKEVPANEWYLAHKAEFDARAAARRAGA